MRIFIRGLRLGWQFYDYYLCFIKVCGKQFGPAGDSLSRI
jgi:hypothetical protein